MQAPERRSRADLLVAAAIVVSIVVAAAVIWLRSDARGTTSITATVPAVAPQTALAVPDELTELWHADNSVGAAPLTAGGAVVTAAGGTVTGRDAVSGNEIWRYQRDMPLCGVISAWGTAVAVYRDRRGCSQVTELAGADGSRRADRSSDADDTVHLSSDGTYVLTQGPTRLEMWRSDLVRTVEYGRIDAPVNPKAQPREGCALNSAVSSSTRLSVLERCPGEDADRLTILNPAPKDSQKPEEYGSTVLAELAPGHPGARVLAVAGDRTAVYLPGDNGASKPSIGVFDATANAIAQYPLSARLAPDARVARVGAGYGVWTGSQLIMLGSNDLAPLWTVAGALGPGTQMAGRTLVPVAGAIAVLDPGTGTETGRIPVQRDAATAGPITLSVIGDVVLEQRGDELVALR